MANLLPNLRSVSVVSIIKIDVFEGEGTRDDPATVVTYYYPVDGGVGIDYHKPLFIVDPRDKEKPDANQPPKQ